MNNKWYQQGDVKIMPVDRIPVAGKKLERRSVLAEGEATGHTHVATGRGVKVWVVGRRRFLHAPNGGTIKHDEHKPVKVPAGDYEIDQVKEYDHFRERTQRVRD